MLHVFDKRDIHETITSTAPRSTGMPGLGCPVLLLCPVYTLPAHCVCCVVGPARVRPSSAGTAVWVLRRPYHQRIIDGLESCALYMRSEAPCRPATDRGPSQSTAFVPGIPPPSGIPSPRPTTPPRSFKSVQWAANRDELWRRQPVLRHTAWGAH